MPVNYSVTVANARLQVMSDSVAGKTIAPATGTATAGVLVIGTSVLSGSTGVLATVPLPTTPFSIASKVATLLGTPLNVTATASGTAALAEFRNNSGTVIDNGLTVGTTGTDVIVGTTAVSSGQTVTVNSGTITHP